MVEYIAFTAFAMLAYIVIVYRYYCLYTCFSFVCWVFSRCIWRLLRIWSSLSCYISRICLIIIYKVHISDYILYFYTFFLAGCLITWWDVYLWYIYCHFFRIEPRKGDYGEFFRKFKALEYFWEKLENFENYILIWNWKLNNILVWKDN